MNDYPTATDCTAKFGMTEDEIVAEAEKINESRRLRERRLRFVRDVREKPRMESFMGSIEHDPFWFMKPDERSRLATFLQNMWGLQ